MDLTLTKYAIVTLKHQFSYISHIISFWDFAASFQESWCTIPLSGGIKSKKSIALNLITVKFVLCFSLLSKNVNLCHSRYIHNILQLCLFSFLGWISFFSNFLDISRQNHGFIHAQIQSCTIFCNSASCLCFVGSPLPTDYVRSSPCFRQQFCIKDIQNPIEHSYLACQCPI